ncbi:MAG: ATP-dependent Clp protease proteolytic subunit [Cyanobacteria bacterium REEB67]|nr:ATP-dependent Clp protease proteolytic subunit [Cyanobacteria bacterium REEB67]
MSDRTLQSIELEIETAKVLTMAVTAEQKLSFRLASLWEAREYLLEGPITFQAISQCINTLDTWRLLDARREVKQMHIILNGTAGIINALALFDYIRWLKLDGFDITIELAGRANRQSALVLAAGSHRVMTESSWLQIDEVSMGTAGNTFEAENHIEWNKRLEAQLRRNLAAGSKTTTRKVAASTRLKGWNVSSGEALALGLVDEVSKARPQRLLQPLHLGFEPLPQAQNEKEALTVATIRKMRAEGALLELENFDAACSAARNGIVRFIDTVTTATVGKAKIDLEAALRLSSADITLLIHSNGGSVTDGLGFIDMARQVNASGRVLNTECLGYAASMGGVMLQCGKKRTMGREAWLLIHKVSSWFGDKTSEAKLSYDYCMQLQKQCFGILAERSVFTADEVAEKCRDHDWWLSAEEALKYGFIDAIR